MEKRRENSTGISVQILTAKDEEVQPDEDGSTAATEDIFTKMCVPNDASCLFWAVTMAYLLPVRNNDSLFSERFLILFGVEHVNKTFNIQQLLIQSESPPRVYENEILVELVTKIFRNRVVDEMMKQEAELFQKITLDDFLRENNAAFITDGAFCQQFESAFPSDIIHSDIDLNKLLPDRLTEISIQDLNAELDKISDKEKVQKFKFHSYLRSMRNCESCAGELEIQAIQRLIKCPIFVINNNKNTKFSITENEKNIFLFKSNQTRFTFGLVNPRIVIESLKSKHFELALNYINIGLDNVNFQDERGDSLLHFAALSDNNNYLINKLIGQGASLNLKNNNQQTPLDVAIKSDLKKSIEALTSHTIDIYKTLRYEVINIEHNQRILIEVIDTNIQPHSVEKSAVLECKIKQLVTTSDLLIDTVNKVSKCLTNRNKDKHVGQIGLCGIRLKDVNNPDFLDWFFLHIMAAEKGLIEPILRPIECGIASVDIRDYNGGTMLQRAIKFGHLEVVNYLIKRGADVKSVGNTSLCALSLAVKAGQLHIVQYLIENEAEINFVDQQGMTPLHHAVQCGQWNIVHFLVENKADVNIADNRNETPLIRAMKTGKWKIVKYLLGQGALLINLSASDKNDIFKHLINNKVSVEEQFYEAIKLGNIEILEMLFLNHKDENLSEALAKAYNDLSIYNLLLHENMHRYIENKLLEFRFYSDNNGIKIRENDQEKANLDNIKNRLKLVISCIDKIIVFENDDDKVSDTFLFNGKFIAQNLHILKRQLSPTYAVLPWEEMQFTLLNFIFCNIHKTSNEIIIKSVLYKRRLLSHLILFKIQLENLEKILSLGDVNAKSKKITRHEAVENILKLTPEFKGLYGDFEILKDVYSLTGIKNYLKSACAVDLNLKPVIGPLVIERALQVIGEYMKNSLESPNMSDSVKFTLMEHAPLNTTNNFPFLRNILSHVDALTLNKSEVGLDSDELDTYRHIQDDLKKLQLEISLILFNKKIQAVKIFAERILACGNIDEVRAIAGGINYNYDARSILSIELHASFYQIKELVRDFESGFKIKDEIHVEVFREFRQLIESNERSIGEWREKHDRGFHTLYSLLSLIKYKSDFDTIKNEIRKVLGFLTLETHFNSKFYDGVSNLTLKIRRTFPEDKLLSPETFRVFQKIILIADVEGKRINKIDFFKFNFEKGRKIDEELREKLFVNIAAQIDQKVSVFSHQLDETTGKLFTEDFELKKKIHAAKRILMEKNKKCPDEIGDLNEFIDLCNVVNFKLVKKETFSLTYEENREKLARHLNRINDSYGKLVKKLSDEPTNNFMQNAFLDFIKTFDSIKNQQHFIDNKQQLFIESGIYFQKLKTMEDIFNTAKNEPDRPIIDLLETNEDVRVAIEMLMLTLTEILDNLSLLESNRLFLDEPSPNLVGKNLRNYLAHGDLLIDILSINYLKSIVSHFHHFKLNCDKEKCHVYTNSQLIGKVTLEDIPKLQAGLNQNWELFKNRDEIFEIANSKNENLFINFIKKNPKNVELFCRTTKGWTLWEAAAKADNLELFKYLLNNNYYNNIHNILYYLAQFGCVNILRFILQKKFNIDINNIINLKKNQTLLHIAAKNNQNEVAKFLIERGADVEATDTLGMTPIQYAVTNGHLNTFLTLLTSGARMDTRDKDGQTLLHAAALGGHAEIVRILLELGLSVHCVDSKDHTPLFIACKLGHVLIAQLLIVNKADVNIILKDVNRNLLHAAILEGHDQIVQLLLEHGADLQHVDADGRRALHIAARYGHHETVKVLLENGADVNDLSDNLTALHLAALNNHARTAQILLENRANVSIKIHKDGITALHLASAKGSMDIVKILLTFGANINEATSEGSTALHFAAINNHTKLVEFLIQERALLDVQDVFGALPLHSACVKGNFEIFEMLKTKINVLEKDKKGRTPFHTAAQWGHQNIVRNLIESGDAEIDSKIFNKNGETALHVAARGGHVEVIKVLLENKADINSCDDDKSTALHEAAKYGYRNIVELLVRNKAKINAVDAIKGWTPLHYAMFTEDKPITKILVESGADVWAEDGHCAVLHRAVKNVDILKLVLDEILKRLVGNADRLASVVNAADKDGDTPLMWAVEQGNLSSAIVLLECDQVDVNRQNLDGWTALHWAVHVGHVEIVNLLVDKNIDVNIEDKNKETAFDLAAKKISEDEKYETIAAVLLSLTLDA